MRWKKEQNAYNFNLLPKKAIITANNTYCKGFKKFFYKKIKGFIGVNYQLTTNYLLCSSFGIGAPAVITLLEELKELGVEEFIFIGFAGILNTKLKENTPFCVTKAFSTSGTSFFYHKNEEIVMKNKLLDTLKRQLNLQTISCWSTDAIYREYSTLIHYFSEKKADTIDMETASIFAFSKFYNVNCACILITSDTIDNNQWYPPKKTQLLTKTIDKLIAKIIKL